MTGQTVLHDGTVPHGPCSRSKSGSSMQAEESLQLDDRVATVIVVAATQKKASPSIGIRTSSLHR
jgi:hypothetical protein